MLIKKVREVVGEYMSWGHSVGTIRSDSEAVYLSIKSDINFLGARACGTGLVPTRVERCGEHSFVVNNLETLSHGTCGVCCAWGS